VLWDVLISSESVQIGLEEKLKMSCFRGFSKKYI